MIKEIWKKTWIWGSPSHVSPLPPKKSSKSAISSSSWASSPSPGASGGASPAWASGQSPGHATSALNWSGVGHEKEAKPWLCMLRLIWYRQSWVCTCARWLAACWRTKCRKYCSMSNAPAWPAWWGGGGAPAACGASPWACLWVQYFSIKARVMGGRITLVGATGTPNDWQSPVISAGNPGPCWTYLGPKGA